MNPQAFGAVISIQTSNDDGEIHTAPAAPKRAFPRTYHSIAEPVELDNLDRNAPKVDGYAKSGATTPSGSQTPRRPSISASDLEASRPSSPLSERDGVDIIQSFSNPPINRFRMLSVCLLNFGNGISDSAPGALIPYIEKHYDIGYALVSLIFVSSALGYIIAAFMVDAIRIKIGRAKTLMLAQALMCTTYIMVVCTPPFPVVVLAFLLLGVGEAMNLALSNVFAANLHNSTKMLGSLHGSYGIGGTVGPLIATAMVTKGNLVWSRYYFMPLGVAAFNAVFSSWSFWNYEAEARQELLTTPERVASNAEENVDATEGAKARVRRQLAGMAKAFKSKVVILGALFIFAYQGAEVSISGWVLSFLIAVRHGNPASVGYVTSGFWGGITIGRFLLSHPAQKIGEKVFVYWMVGGAVVFELLVWFVPNVVGDAVSIAIVGLLLGPVYPCSMVIFSRAIGRKEQISSLGVISAFGSSGGAVAPFTTGILAQAVGTFVLHPIAIGLFAVMVACWFGLPNTRKRTE